MLILRKSCDRLILGFKPTTDLLWKNKQDKTSVLVPVFSHMTSIISVKFFCIHKKVIYANILIISQLVYTLWKSLGRPCVCLFQLLTFKKARWVVWVRRGVRRGQRQDWLSGHCKTAAERPCRTATVCCAGFYMVKMRGAFDYRLCVKMCVIFRWHIVSHSLSVCILQYNLNVCECVCSGTVV